MNYQQKPFNLCRFALFHKSQGTPKLNEKCLLQINTLLTKPTQWKKTVAYIIDKARSINSSLSYIHGMLHFIQLHQKQQIPTHTQNRLSCKAHQRCSMWPVPWWWNKSYIPHRYLQYYMQIHTGIFAWTGLLHSDGIHLYILKQYLNWNM